MRVLRNRPETVVLTLIVVGLTTLYALLGIPSREGFNPSDDGVILAQSYRIIHGELPHRDFISIRPAGSAAMHAVNFISPLPLELSARWLVLLEYLFGAVLITSVLAGSWFRGLRKSLFLLAVASSVMLIFLLNQNFYNLFPWTTIDALFWFSLALYGWYKLKNGKSDKRGGWQVLVLFGATMALLCRQTFALPSFLLAGRMIWWETGRSGQRDFKALLKMLPALVIGTLPGWIYVGVLTFTGSWSAFFHQMSGRTELWETGIAKFWSMSWHSPVQILFGLTLVVGLVKIWLSESNRNTYWADRGILLVKFVSFTVKIVLAFLVFLKPEHLFYFSFQFFFLLVLDLFLIYNHDGRLPRWTWPALWILLMAWTSAVSLGDNAPVFATGFLAGTAMMMQVKDFWDKIYRNARPYQWVAAGILLPALLVISLVTQQRVNYRDLPAEKLTCDGGKIFPGLAGIRISPDMEAYLGEIRKLYEDSGRPAGHFCVLPNNALVYPLLGSRNPLPLDWMQQPEFVGREAEVVKAFKQILSGNPTVVLVEKMNVKWIAGNPVPVDFRSPDYPYLPLLDSLAVEVDAGSRFFRVYRTK